MAVKKAAKAMEPEEDVRVEDGTASNAKEHTGPIAKPKKHQKKVEIKDLYPWAANRGKAERAHKHVKEGGRTDENPNGDRSLHDLSEGTPEFDQAVMDHYTLHGGLVIGQEKATVVGRKKLGNWHPGATTTEVVGEVDQEGGAEDAKEAAED